MKVFSDDFSNKIIFGKYKIFKRIGIGIYSNVFSGIIINNLEQIAFKIQEKRDKCQRDKYDHKCNSKRVSCICNGKGN